MPNQYRSIPLADRLWAKVNKDGPVPVRRPDLGPCWLFTGRDRMKRGYGLIGRGPKGAGKILVHRLSYELAFGPIPDGLHIDHLCWVTNCVNPRHLEAVTLAENARRRRKPTCAKGHSMADAYVNPTSGRRCRECMRQRYSRSAALAEVLAAARKAIVTQRAWAESPGYYTDEFDAWMEATTELEAALAKLDTQEGGAP